MAHVFGIIDYRKERAEQTKELHIHEGKSGRHAILLNIALFLAAKAAWYTFHTCDGTSGTQPILAGAPLLNTCQIMNEIPLNHLVIFGALFRNFTILSKGATMSFLCVVLILFVVFHFEIKFTLTLLRRSFKTKHHQGRLQ